MSTRAFPGVGLLVLHPEVKPRRPVALALRTWLFVGTEELPRSKHHASRDRALGRRRWEASRTDFSSSSQEPPDTFPLHFTGSPGGRATPKLKLSLISAGAGFQDLPRIPRSGGAHDPCGPWPRPVHREARARRRPAAGGRPASLETPPCGDPRLRGRAWMFCAHFKRPESETDAQQPPLCRRGKCDGNGSSARLLEPPAQPGHASAHGQQHLHSGCCGEPARTHGGTYSWDVSHLPHEAHPGGRTRCPVSRGPGCGRGHPHLTTGAHSPSHGDPRRPGVRLRLVRSPFPAVSLDRAPHAPGFPGRGLPLCSCPHLPPVLLLTVTRWPLGGLQPAGTSLGTPPPRHPRTPVGPGGGG